MAFPLDPIQIRVELALGADPSANPSTWSWTDVTQWVRQAYPITISRGRPDEFAVIPHAICSLTVDNADGRWVARNPRGAWSGQIRVGAPLRVSVNPGSGWTERFTGFIDALPVRQDLSGRNRYVPLTASGLLKRLSRPKAPLRSPSYRFVQTQDTARVYLPLEDGEGAQRAMSGLPGRPHGERFGSSPLPRWATVAGPPGSAALPDFADRRSLTGLVSGWGDDEGQWSVSCWISGASATGGSTCSPVQWQTDGSARYWALLARWPGDGSGTQTSAGQLRIWVLAMAPNAGENFALEDITNEVTIDSADNDWHHVRVVASDSSGDIQVDLYVDGDLADSSSASGYTVGRPIQYHVNPTTERAAYLDVPGVGIGGIGHLLIETFGSGGGGYLAGLGYPGEVAGTRIWAVADEADIPITDTRFVGVPMGPEPIGTALDVMRDAAATDSGLLYELTTGGLTYLSSEDRYNFTAAMVLDWSAKQVAPPFEPTDDDQQLRNAVTAARRSGTSATYVDEDHVERYGRYEDGVQVNPELDASLMDQAAWRARQGTVDDLRVSRLSLKLAHPSQASLVADWLACDIGSRIQVESLPQEYMAEALDLVVEGYTETLQTPRVWEVDLNCSPASPWTVGVVEDEVLGRVDTDGSEWVADVDAGTDTSALVVVTAGPPWITTANQADMFPFDVRSSGVVLSVTGIAAAVADVYARTVAAGGWGTATTGQSWSVVDGTASNFSVSSGSGRIALTSTNAMHTATIATGHTDHDPRYELTCPVAPAGAAIAFWAYARWVDGSNNYYSTLAIGTDGAVDLRLFKRVSGSATQLGDTVRLSPTHSAGNTWVLQIGVLGDTVRCRAWRSDWPEERGWFISVTDTDLTSGTDVAVGCRRETGNSNGSQTMVIDGFIVPSLQTFTLDATPVNGVSKTIHAGVPLSLAHPWRLAL